MSRDQLDTMFKEYEVAIDKQDVKTISGYCANSLISAGPNGSIAQSRKDFEKQTEQTNKFYKNIGRNSARIISKRVIPICNDYTMVVVRWGITFEKTGNKLKEFDRSYIIEETGSDPKIILIISHEDEEKAIKKMDLQKQ